MDLSIVSSIGDGISTVLHGLWQGFQALIPAIGGIASDIEGAIGSGEPNETVTGSIGEAIGSAGEAAGSVVSSAVTGSAS